MNGMSSDDPDTIRFNRFVPPEEDDEIEAQARFFGVTVDQMIQDIEPRTILSGGGRHQAIHEFHWQR
ncbi:hypothetical protein JJ691_98940 [Kutzneria sp. CA-103260]|nr:hypothetical protein JJ691_98940 [Kutzneria sp. CA-103260]